MDNTGGTKTNLLSLNLAHVHMGMDPPEAGIASVMIDGVPIHAVHYIKIEAQAGTITKCVLQFECEVSGKIGGQAVAEFLREAKGD